MSSRSDEQASAERAFVERASARPADGAIRVIDSGRVEVVSAAMPPSAQVAELADVFGLLADPGRLRVLVALLEGEMCVSDLAAVGQASESAVSHHLRLLRAHRVVEVRRSGRMAYYRLADAHVRMLLDVALTHIGHAPAAAHPERSDLAGHPGPSDAAVRPERSDLGGDPGRSDLAGRPVAGHPGPSDAAADTARSGPDAGHRA